jgi:hypothetical protein
MTRPALRLHVLALAVALSACQGGGDMRDPAYGTATCAACGDVINAPRSAAQYRLPDAAGTVKSFDDPACLFDALRGEPAAPTVIRFRAYDDMGWLVAKDTWFARTPATLGHGSGWAAYPSFAAAQEAVTVAGSGEILSFEQAKGALRRNP